MQCTVYRKRENGHVLANYLPGVAGDLTISPHTIGTNDPQALWAQLLNPDGTPALPPLHNCRVTRITGAGIVIHGVEPIPKSASIKARIYWFEQTWWCKVGAGSEARFMAALMGPPRG